MRRLEASSFCTDYLTSGLAGVPSLGVRHESSSEERGIRLWPVLEGLLRNIAEAEPAYVVEGDVLLPELVGRLRASHPSLVRACFLGYPECPPATKEASIRAHPRPVNDWVADMADGALRDLVAEMIAFSRFLEAECRQHELPFFDGSHDFELALARAEDYLVGGVAE